MVWTASMAITAVLAAAPPSPPPPASATATLPAAAVVPAPVAATPAGDAAGAEIEVWVHAPAEADRLLQHLASAAAQLAKRIAPVGETTGLADELGANVAMNLKAKRLLDAAGPRLPMSATDIERTVIDYEAFKIEAFITSGVFPKRYFGYFDDKYDTADYERRLRRTVSRVAGAINAYQAEHHRPVRVADIEIAITFLAEGGALFLRDKQELLMQLHPVYHVGLDDLASGFADLPGLQQELDAAAGTNVSGLVAWMKAGATQLPEPTVVAEGERWLKHGNGHAGPFPYLKRYMTFEEGLVGTALMYLWEKELAAKKVSEARLRPLNERPLDEQFIIASLVYNSGLLHAPERWEMIRTFKTAAWLHATSEANARTRWRLPVLLPTAALDLLRGGGVFPEQPTSWVAVYHVLQRYGALVAMQRFTDVFKTDGSFARVP